MFCQDCGVEAPTKQVTFYQNIGLLVMRIPSSVEGELCKSCIHKHFWTMTLITLVAGPWGMISLIVTPFFLLNNIGRYLFCLGMEPVPVGATSPQLTSDVVDRISPYADDLFSRLESGEEFDRVASIISSRAGVSPGQVYLYVRAVVQAQSQPQQQ